MAWIESHQELGNHPKLLRLCRVLGISQPQAVGHLHFLWWWSVDYCDDGDLSRFDPLDIAIAGMWDGDPNAFLDALVQCGWVDRSDACLHVHDWDRYLGRLIDKRAANAERMRASRANKNPQRATHVQRTSSARATTNDARAGATKPNQTKQYLKGANAPMPTDAGDGGDEPEPKPLYSDDFEAFWKQYPRGRGIKFKAFTEWKSLRKSDRESAAAALPGWLRCEMWQDPSKILYCERWLKGRAWENDPPPASRPVITQLRPANGKPDFRARIGINDPAEPQRDVIEGTWR